MMMMMMVCFDLLYDIRYLALQSNPAYLWSWSRFVDQHLTLAHASAEGGFTLDKLIQ